MKPFISSIVDWYRSSLGRRLLVVAGSLVGLFVLVNYIVLPLYVNAAGHVTVPSVVGVPKEEAFRTLEDADLLPVEADTRPDPEHPPGTVVQQNPLANAVVKEGRRVYVSLSGGEIQVPVPSLRGRSLRDARFALERHGLKLGSVAFDTSDSFPENTIIAQSVGADARVSKGTMVNITVSRGRQLSAAQVPLVIGKTLGEAQGILRAAGLRVGIVTYQQSFDLLPNTVVDQFPRPGEVLGPGQGIDLFVVQTGRPAEEFQTPPN
jgi:beta-lactam-binding protein with PASTA domain